MGKLPSSRMFFHFPVEAIIDALALLIRSGNPLIWLDSIDEENARVNRPFPGA